MRFHMTGALVSLIGAAGLAAQSPARSTPSGAISGIAYRVTFTKQSAAERMVTSEMSFDASGDAVVLSLPAWTPGEYEIGNFARNVTSFTASENDTPIEWHKIDPDSWRLVPKGSGRVTVTFDYQADVLDNGASWARSDFLLFNGTNLFLYPESPGASFASTVTVVTDSSWKTVTGMERTGNRVYSAANYHDLVDMPFFVGVFDLDSAQVAGKWVRLATYPAGSISGSKRADVWASLKKVIPPEVRVFGEVPWRDYSVLQITDSTYPQGSGAGLEHQSSHVEIVSPALVGSSVMPSLYAHEIFHAWNVKRSEEHTSELQSHHDLV